MRVPGTSQTANSPAPSSVRGPATVAAYWHSRYGGRGILVYWHVERGSVVVHSQMLKASASEVAAMVEGAIRHGTTMKVEGNYVDPIKDDPAVRRDRGTPGGIRPGMRPGAPA